MAGYQHTLMDGDTGHIKQRGPCPPCGVGSDEFPFLLRFKYVLQSPAFRNLDAGVDSRLAADDLYQFVECGMVQIGDAPSVFVHYAQNLRRGGDNHRFRSFLLGEADEPVVQVVFRQSGVIAEPCGGITSYNE